MEYQCGNIFIRPNPPVPNALMQPGEKCREHMHNFSHVTFFVAGVFVGRRWRRALDASGKQIVVNGEEVWNLVDEREFHAGQWCLIERDVKHEFECVVPGRFLCCYSHRDPQSHEVVQGFNGWMKAYE